MKPIIDSMFADVNPIPVKAALAKMGMFKPFFRLPTLSAFRSRG